MTNRAAGVLAPAAALADPAGLGLTLGRALGLAVVYAALARLGLAFDAVGGFATLVWPPSGLSLAALLLGGRRLWPGVLLGAFVANASAGAPLPVAAAIAVGNTAEAVVAVLALQRLGFRPTLERVRDVLALVTCGALASPLIAASLGVASLWAGGLIQADGLVATWTSWWMGDALGDLVVAPALLVWFAGRDRQPAEAVNGPSSPEAAPPPHLLEAVALTAIAAGLALLVFVVKGQSGPLRQPFLLFPVVVWAAVRFRQRAVTLVVLLVAVAAVAGTALGHGPFARDRLVEGLTALQVFTAVLATGGLVLGALVAERQRAEQALAEAVRVRDEFLSVASHELRTPLSVLSLDLSRLVRLEEQPGRLGERLRRSLRQVERLEGLIKNLLGASRIAHGRLQVEPEPCDLGALAREVIDVFAADVDRTRGPSIALQVTTSVVGQWDCRLIEQALTNLVSNAIKYGRGAPVELTIGCRDGTATVAVKDGGIGIPVEHQVRIFERFERAAPPRNFGGLGLGLYITRQIAEAHGGRVTVQSSPGVGSTFLLELPLSASAPAATSSATPGSS